MSLSRRHLATIAAVAAAVAGVWLASGVGSERAKAPAVDYTLLDGRRLNVAGLQGKVVLVNFWATSCTTCVKEMPELVATYERYRTRGYDTLAVAMQYDPPAYVATFAESRQLPFGVAIDNTGEIARQFGQIRLTPTSVLIDKHGAIVKRYVGAPDFAALHTLIEQLLAER